MIELKVDKFQKGIVTFHIARQDKKDYDRLYRKLFCHQDFYLTSAYSPFCTENMFGVRGSCKELDEKKLEVDIGMYIKICCVVKKFNDN